MLIKIIFYLLRAKNYLLAILTALIIFVLASSLYHPHPNSSIITLAEQWLSQKKIDLHQTHEDPMISGIHMPLAKVNDQQQQQQQQHSFSTEAPVKRKHEKNSQLWESALFSSKGDSYILTRQGKYILPDFSRAGYRQGKKILPRQQAQHFISPIQGDNTKHLQAAINQAQGGVLHLAPGNYPVSSEIIIPTRTVLRGSGSDSTFIYATNTSTKNQAILVGYRSSNTTPPVNRWTGNKKHPILHELTTKSRKIKPPTTKDFHKDDWVIVGNILTDEFRLRYNQQLKVKGATIWPAGRSSIKYLRKVVDIEADTLILDQPIWLSLGDNEKNYICKTSAPGLEIGIEDLAIGYQQPNGKISYNNLAANGDKDNTHAAKAIYFGNVANGWIRNIKSFSPDSGKNHLHSSGIALSHCRNTTVRNCDIGFPANIGGGGNGYLYVLSMCNDCLIKDCVARKGRHNFLFHYPSSGNVITGCKSLYSFLPNDFHHSLAHANLIDNMNIITNSGYYAFEIRDRKQVSAGAGLTGVNNVFWNIHISGENKYNKSFKIWSEQGKSSHGGGYLIGVTDVAKPQAGGKNTEWREGVGDESGLRPGSLYKAQLTIFLDKYQHSEEDLPEAQ